METIYICANVETLVDGYGLPSETESEVAADMQQAAVKVAEASSLSVDLRYWPLFRDWHGGKFDQFYARSGLVAVPKDAPQEVKGLARQMSDAMENEAVTASKYFEVHADEFGD